MRWKSIKHRKDIKMYQNEARKRREKIAEKLADGQLLLSFGGNDELGVVGIPQREKTDKKTEESILKELETGQKVYLFPKPILYAL